MYLRIPISIVYHEVNYEYNPVEKINQPLVNYIPAIVHIYLYKGKAPHCMANAGLYGLKDAG
jgi:hypothetical protein